MNTKNLLRAVLSLAAILLLPSAYAADVFAVRAVYSPNALALPAFFAQEKGLFTEHGVQVTLTRGEQANLMISSVASGTSDAAIGVSLLPALLAESQQPGTLRIAFHSAMTVEQPFDSIIVLRESPIHTLKDLSGATLGTYPGTTASSVMKYFLKKNGVDPESVKFLPLPANAHPNALAAGGVSALFTYEPQLTAILLDGRTRRIQGSVFAALQPGCPISSCILSREAERKNGEAMRRFVAALADAVRAIDKDPVEARALLPKFTPVSAETAKTVALVKDVTPDKVSRESLEEFVRLMKEIGELKKPIDIGAMLAPTR